MAVYRVDVLLDELASFSKWSSGNSIPIRR